MAIGNRARAVPRTIGAVGKKFSPSLTCVSSLREETYLSSEAVPGDADINCVESFPTGGGRTVDLSREEDGACASSPYSAFSRPSLGEADEFEQRFVQARLVDQEGDGG